MFVSRALLKRHSVLPGFGLALGFALLYLGLIVLIPLSAAFLKTFTLSWGQFLAATPSPRVLASYRLTFGASLLAALLDAVFGLQVVWALVRCRFPARRLVDALVDLPFALPTAVAGIALTALYVENGWIGLTRPQHFGHLARRALVHAQAHQGVTGAERMHRLRQRAAGLRVGGGHAQAAAVLLGKVLTGPPQVVGLLQQALDDRQHRRAGRRQPGQALAGAHEDGDAQLIVQLADLPADARLRGVQGLRDSGQVEAPADGFAHRAQLLEVHERPAGGGGVQRPHSGW